MNSGILKSVMALTLGLGAMASANAATISDSFSNAQATTEINQTGVLDLFDSSLGVLTGVSFTVTLNATQSFSGTNTAAQAQQATIASSVELSLGSGNAAIDAILSGVSLSVISSSGIQSYAVGETKSFGPFTPSDLENFTGPLAAFLGSGTFDVECVSVSGFGVTGGGGNISTTQATTAGCSAMVEYTYREREVVPEPGSLALLGLGLLGLGAARRRKA